MIPDQHSCITVTESGTMFGNTEISVPWVRRERVLKQQQQQQ